MKKLLSIIAFGIISSFAFSQTNNIIGTWITEEKDAHIEIYQNADSKYYGKIVWLSEPNDPKTGKQILDKNNKNKSKRNLPIMNSVMLWEFEFENDEFVNGHLYDSRDGATYSGKLWLENNNNLKMRGYWGFFFKTTTWKRLK